MKRTSLCEMIDRTAGTKIETAVTLERMLREASDSFEKLLGLVNVRYMPSNAKGKAVMRSRGYPCDT